MALYKNLEMFCTTCKIAGQPDNNLIAGMHVLSSDYKYSDSKVGQELLNLAIGSADVGLEDIYGMALLAGNVYDDIEKNEEMGARLVIDSAERGNVESVYPAALCLIGGIGIERDPERANKISSNSINACTNDQERAIATQSSNGVVSLLVLSEKDPEAAQEYIVQTINDLGSSTHDDLLEASGGRLFNQEIVNRLQINEFEDGPSKSSSEPAGKDTIALQSGNDDPSAVFKAAFPSDIESSHPVFGSELRESAENELLSSANPNDQFNLALELLSSRYEEGGTLDPREYLIKAVESTVDWKLLSYAMGNCAEALITGEVFDDIKQDLYLAIRLLEVGDKKENSLAQHMLGICYFLGAGVDFDSNKAIFYWTKSEKNGDLYGPQFREKAISLPREEFQKELVDKLKDRAQYSRAEFENKYGRTTVCHASQRSDLKRENDSSNSKTEKQSSKGFFGKLFGR